MPTNDGLACVWVGIPAARFEASRPEDFRVLLAQAAPEVAH